MQASFETEVKIRVSDSVAAQESIRDAGFCVAVEEVFESNTLYDTAALQLRERGQILRVRQVGGKHILTFKGRGQDGPYKSREELETPVGSSEMLAEILGRLEYRPVFRYEKYRTEYRSGEDPRGVVTLDRTPIGHFLELEGEGEWIDKTAAALGFARNDYVLDSYGKLYLADCKRRGVEPSNMVFSSQAV